MVRLIATDLDGTLLDDQKNIPAANRRAIDQARQAGIHVVLCSGRSPQSIVRYVRELHLDWGGEYYIASNGAVVLEGASQQPIHTCCLPPGAAGQLVAYARQHGELVNPHLYAEGKFLVERYLPSTQRYEMLSGSQCTLVDSLDPYLDQPMYKMLFNNLGTPRQLIALQERLKDHLPKHVQMFRSAAFLLEFVHEQAGKWNAVDYIRKILNIEKEEILCIGDNENDLSMVMQAGMGAAPAGAEKVVCQHASYVSEKTNNEGAVAQIIEHFLKQA